jgi:UDP-N-acetylglucosamine---dolichyl-phosphate N-acetylglucosaminyltransferase
MKLLIGIPAYEEGRMIGSVLSFIPKKIPGFTKTDVLVVDDGSEDNTGEIAKKHGVIVLTHLINRGLGGALKTILNYAKIHSYDFLVMLDADGQHDICDLKDLIKPIIEGKADVVIGSRWKKGNHKPISRYLINQFANIATYLLFNFWTSDSQSGYRAFNKKAINMINLVTDGMEVSSEIIKEIKRNNLNYTEVPIQTIYSNYSITKGQQLSNAPEVFFRLLLRLLR